MGFVTRGKPAATAPLIAPPTALGVPVPRLVEAELRPELIPAPAAFKHKPVTLRPVQQHLPVAVAGDHGVLAQLAVVVALGLALTPVMAKQSLSLVIINHAVTLAVRPHAVLPIVAKVMVVVVAALTQTMAHQHPLVLPQAMAVWLLFLFQILLLFLGLLLLRQINT